MVRLISFGMWCLRDPLLECVVVDRAAGIEISYQRSRLKDNSMCNVRFISFGAWCLRAPLLEFVLVEDPAWGMSQQRNKEQCCVLAFR